VSASWLAGEVRNVVVVDATWALTKSAFVGERCPLETYRSCRIPGAKFWDLDQYSDPEPAPHTPHNLPSPAQFSEAAASCGIEKGSRVVCYDQFGVFSSPRLWLTLCAYGVDAAILDGGLPAWIAGGNEVADDDDDDDDHDHDDHEKRGKETWTRSNRKIEQWRLADVEKWLLQQEKSTKLLDARPAARFDGSVPDPRGLRSGHIPNSINVPFLDVLQPSPDRESKTCQYGGAFRGATLKDDAALRDIFIKTHGIHPGDRVALTCGSGLTAATLALALHRLDVNDVSLYDGSWLDYASNPDTPVATTTNK